MQFRAAKKTAQDVYICDPLDTDNEGNSITFLDIVSDDVSIADSVDLKIESEKLYGLMEKYLNDREREIIVLRYGLCGKIPITQMEVSRKLKISRS